MSLNNLLICRHATKQGAPKEGTNHLLDDKCSIKNQFLQQGYINLNK